MRRRGSSPLLSGLLGVAAGLIVLRHPLLAALTVPTVIVIVLGIEGLVIGALEIIACFRGGGFGSFIAGAFNIIIGLLLLALAGRSLARPAVRLRDHPCWVQGVGLRSGPSASNRPERRGNRPCAVPSLRSQCSPA